MNIIAHLINLSPTISLNSDVLDRVWFSKDISYNHLHVFDCKVFMHVPKYESLKLDVKTY